MSAIRKALECKRIFAYRQKYETVTGEITQKRTKKIQRQKCNIVILKHAILCTCILFECIEKEAQEQ